MINIIYRALLRVSGVYILSFVLFLNGKRWESRVKSGSWKRNSLTMSFPYMKACLMHFEYKPNIGASYGRFSRESSSFWLQCVVRKPMGQLFFHDPKGLTITQFPLWFDSISEIVRFPYAFNIVISTRPFKNIFTPSNDEKRFAQTFLICSWFMTLRVVTLNLFTIKM